MPITVAIIEDLDEIREGLRNYISTDTGLEVVAVSATGEEALRILPAFQPDIVIMDINLPGINGIDCIHAVKGECPHSQFMMFTVYENDEKVFQALQAGASGYLLKNASPEHILEALKELYNGGSPMSPNIARKLVNIFREEHKTIAPSSILTPRENDILQLLAQGLLYKEIAVRLSISIGTVRQHIHSIYEKLHVQNRTEALNKVYKK
jgi:DNA-binding NarL/FixJ family response regulator